MSQSNAIQTTSVSNQNEKEHKQSNFLHHPRKTIRLTLITVGLSISAAFGCHWWYYQATHESTDDAYVTEDISPISATVSGTVTQVLVKDNQHVDAGTVLVKLDP